MYFPLIYVILSLNIIIKFILSKMKDKTKKQTLFYINFPEEKKTILLFLFLIYSAKNLLIEKIICFIFFL